MWQPTSSPFIPQTALFPGWAWPLVLSVSKIPQHRPPVGGSRVSEVVGRGAALRTDKPGPPRGVAAVRSWDAPPAAVRSVTTPPTPLTVFIEEARSELATSIAKGQQDPMPRACRRENNDRTGSASRRASGFPSRQAGLSRNLGGAVFSMGVQCRCGPGMGAKVFRRV